MAFGRLQHDYVHGDAKITVVTDAGRLKVGAQVPYWVEPKFGEPYRKWKNRADLVDHNTQGLDPGQIQQLAGDYFLVAKEWLQQCGSDVVAKVTGEVWHDNQPIKDSFFDYEKKSFTEKEAAELRISNEEKALLEGLPYYGMF